MLQTNEYEEIKNDYNRISREHFDAGYVSSQDMSFKTSDALFPPFHLESILGTEFEKQCRILCFGEYPKWKQVQQRFKEIQELL